MGHFQPGDQIITISGQPYRLRLTLGALCELAERLEAAGPLALAGKFRQMQSSSARTLLACLLRPCCPSQDADKLAASVPKSELAAAMKGCAACVQAAFHEALDD